LEADPDVDNAHVCLGCDAQTSGGLLIAVAPEKLSNLQTALTQRGVNAFVIGHFSNGPAGRIALKRSLTNGSAPEQSTVSPNNNAPQPMNTSPKGGDGHQPGCCADVFDATSPSTAAETQKAFATFMRAVQSGGTIDEKTKELILFSLVLQSRCKPCFAAHYQRAQELGLTQAELDEAAWCAIAMGGAPVRMFYQECLKAAGQS
jgi:AhpD family alkylhydroperoxidase